MKKLLIMFMMAIPFFCTAQIDAQVQKKIDSSIAILTSQVEYLMREVKIKDTLIFDLSKFIIQKSGSGHVINISLIPPVTSNDPLINSRVTAVETKLNNIKTAVQ